MVILLLLCCAAPSVEDPADEADTDADADTDASPEPLFALRVDDGRGDFTLSAEWAFTFDGAALSGTVRYASKNLYAPGTCDQEIRVSGAAYVGDCPTCDFQFSIDDASVRSSSTVGICRVMPTFSLLESDHIEDLVVGYATPEAWIGYTAVNRYEDEVVRQQRTRRIGDEERLDGDNLFRASVSAGEGTMSVSVVYQYGDLGAQAYFGTLTEVCAGSYVRSLYAPVAGAYQEVSSLSCDVEALTDVWSLRAEAGDQLR
ncbi:MAG: hypothetical protein AAFV53_33445, partial [Myxococcota bacterium]